MPGLVADRQRDGARDLDPVPALTRAQMASLVARALEQKRVPLPESPPAV